LTILSANYSYAVSPAETLYEKAEVLFEQGRYADSARLFEEFTEKYPTHELSVNGLYNLAWGYYYMGEFKKSADNFDKIVKDFPQSSYVEDAQLNIGESYSQLKEYDKAIEAYSNLVKEYPKSEFVDDALYSIGWAYYSKEEVKPEGGKGYESASGILKRFLQTYPESSLIQDVRYLLATIMGKIGKHEEEIKILEEIVKDKDSLIANRAHFNIGEALLERGSYESAIEFYRKVRSREKVLKDISARLEVLAREKKDILTSGKNLSEVLRVESRLKELYKKVEGEEDLATLSIYQIGSCYYSLDRFYEARIIYREIIQRYPKTEDAKKSSHGVILTYWQQKKLNETRKSYEKFIQEFGKDNIADNVRSLIGNVLFEDKRYKEALDEYERGAQEFPNGRMREFSSYQAANCLFSLEEFEKSAKSYERFIKDFNKSQYVRDVQFRLAYSYYSLKSFKDSLKIYQEIKNEYPKVEDMDSILYYTALCYYQLEDYANSIETLESMLKEFPDTALKEEAIFKLGDNYYSLEKFKDAIINYSKVKELFPRGNLADYAYYQIGMSYYYQNEVDNMLAAYKELIEKYPESKLIPDTTYQIGIYYGSIGAHDQAIDEFKKIIEKFKETPVAANAQFLIGESLTKAERLNEAKVEYEKVLELYGDSSFVIDALSGIGNIYLRESMYEEGNEYYTKLIKRFEGATPALKSLVYAGWAEFLYKREDYAGAKKVFDEMGETLPSRWLPPKVSLLIGGTLFHVGEYKKALESYKKIIDGTFKDGTGEGIKESAWAGLGKCELALKDWKVAKTYFEKLLSEYPGTDFEGEAKLGIARSLEGTGEINEAEEAYQKVVSGFKGEVVAEALFRLGELYFVRNEYEKANTFFLRVGLLYSYYDKWASSAVFKSGQVQERLGNKDEARKMYQDLVSQFPKSAHMEDAKKKLGELK